MIQYQSTVLISVPSEPVWRVLADVEHWREWTASITRIEPLDPPAFAVGTRFKVFQPRLRPLIWTITDLRPGTSFTWASKSLGMKVVAEHMIEPAGEGESKVTLRTTFSGPVGFLVGRLSGTMTQEYMGLEARGLKQRSEGQG